MCVFVSGTSDLVLCVLWRFCSRNTRSVSGRLRCSSGSLRGGLGFGSSSLSVGAAEPPVSFLLLPAAHPHFGSLLGVLMAQSWVG